MQRMVILAVLAMLTMLAGCAARDPNLAVKGMNEFGRAPGDYTLHVNLYDLDADGKPRLAAQDDPSLRGFVTRTLAARGYTLKASGPARYDLHVHLLCGNMRKADMGLMAEELNVPAVAVGSGHTEQVFYWLPDKDQSADSREIQSQNDSTQRSRVASDSSRATLGGTTPSRAQQESCQGRVLVALSPAISSAGGPAREVFVARASTGDCSTVAGCPADVCRTALEQSLVELLERRF
jgi:hypothetical protein